MASQCADAVTDELEKIGLRYVVEHGGKHLKIRYGENLEHVQIVASTPSDWRAPMNERAQIRRSLASLGYIAQDAEPEENALVTLYAGEACTFSYDMARNFSKQHKDVLRAIDNLLSVEHESDVTFNERNFAPIDYLDNKGRKHRAFRLTESGFALLAMGFTGDAAIRWKVKYLAAFNAMRSEIDRVRGTSEDMVLRSEFDAVVDMMADIERRQIPAPERGRKYIPPAMTLRKKRRYDNRRAGPQRDWRLV